MYLRINLWVLFFLDFFASHLVRATIARITTRWVNKIVDEVGSTVFYKNISRVFATTIAITKADLAVDFTIFHFRMSSIQPTWPDCTTSVGWHTCCWHFCSCSSHKTIPSLSEFGVARLRSVWVVFLPTGTTQVFVMITNIGYKVK